MYEDWQMGCCGTPFTVGDEVAWKLVAVDRPDRQGDHHGADAWVENHGGPDRPTTGRVHAIELVHQEYTAHHDPLTVEPAEPRSGGLVFRSTGRALEPVPGARTLEPVERCPKWFDEFEEEEQPPRRVPFRVRRAVGALVTLDVRDLTHVLHVPDDPDAEDDGDDGDADGEPDGAPPQPGDPR
ncbi:hypothetical protein GCM10010503_15170 [Streptomyces lucensis JCM 4490]|uniref:Uncharacterized protein n=1 Tax=Streptomyces lucensis JCM 4490 TaxID=1306176 RepID=A0A918MNV3_9ACTN|nr:hypothetical protein GCM10010503_15170 [Streptomyces lucensis JCM 4490]